MAISTILLAAPRTGTTVLGDAVSRSFQACWPHEIFNEAYADPEADYRSAPDLRVRANFFNFRHDMFHQRPELTYPSAANRRFLFRTYIEYLFEAERSERLLLDVKYTSLHHLDGYWMMPRFRPGLIALVQEFALPVVHLRRRNLFALYCSQTYAEMTGIWSSVDGSHDLRPIVIDPAHCLSYMTEIADRERRVRQWLGNGQFWEIEYETMLTGTSFSQSVIDVFTAAFGRSPVSRLDARYRKVTPPLSAIVQNPEDVLTGLQDTPFQAMAQEALMCD